MRSGIVLYTANIGRYDHFAPPTDDYDEIHLRHGIVIDPGVDYLCFTDNPSARSSVFRIVTVPIKYGSAAKTSREIKILPHRYVGEYAMSVWMDFKFIPKNPHLKQTAEEYLDGYDICMVDHRKRNCIYEEKELIATKRIDYLYTIDKQIERYRARGYPAGHGLVEASVMFRRHGEPDVVRAMEWWHREMMQYSGRDQLSFNYVTWELGQPFRLISHVDRNRHFQELRRVKEKQRLERLEPEIELEIARATYGDHDVTAQVREMVKLAGGRYLFVSRHDRLDERFGVARSERTELAIRYRTLQGGTARCVRTATADRLAEDLALEAMPNGSGRRANLKQPGV